MEKMRMESVDMTAQNIEKIGALFPNCITETVGEDGKMKKAVNFDLLRQMLSGDVLEGDEAYEFTWVGKKAAIVEANKPIRKTLRPCKEDSVNWDTTENLYIEGDNLEVLKLLQESYLGAIKVIYIDPPYNTGSDTFMYPDNYRMDKDEYSIESGSVDEEGNHLFKENNASNPRFHSTWCSMMYSRLLLARNLLSDDGVIFISIDEREYANIRDICDEVFGEKNYFGDLVWEATTQPINAGSARFGLQKKTEPILVYGKCKNKVAGFTLEEIEGNLSYPHRGKFGPCRFEIIEKSDSGDYSRPSMKFQILGQYPRDGKRWQIGEDTARQLEKEGKVEIVDGIVKKAVYPEDELDKRQYKPFWSLLLADAVGTAQTGKDEFNSIMETPMGFDTVKPTALMKKLLSYMGDNYTVLDFFSGTATTADACLQLNASTQGKRKFIMVQIDEKCKVGTDAYSAGYSNICEIGKERIRRAAKKAATENSGASFDTGFRVLKLDSSNMKDVYYAPAEYEQGMLSGLESNIKEDRTDLDLLFGCLLEWGLPLSERMTVFQIDGVEVYAYGMDAEEYRGCKDGMVFYENDIDNQSHTPPPPHTHTRVPLLACFADRVPESVMRGIAGMKPLCAVFRDSCFQSSPAKINVTEVFKLLAPDTRVKVI